MPKTPRPVTLSAGLFHTLTGLLDRRVPVVVVTVVEARGSAPGKAGAKMLVTAEATAGTVGGGRVENAAIGRARKMLGTFAGPELERVDVVQDLGMSCGGSMSLMYEPLTPPPRLVLFGAGHVSGTLCPMATLAGFEVTVCDEREDWLTPERFPTARDLILDTWEKTVERAGIDERTFVTSCSPGHAIDAGIVKAIAALGLRPRYLGVIGSRRKGALLRKEFAGSGLDPAFVDSIHVPMGLNIGAVDPREIAVAVTAELVAVLRGVDRVEPW